MPKIITPASNSKYFNESIALNNADILEIQKAVGLEAAISVGFIYNKYESKAGKLTFAERKVNFKSIEKNFNIIEEELLKEVKQTVKVKQTKLLADIRKAINTKDFKRLEALKVKFSGKIASKYAASMKNIFEYGKKAAADELKEKIPGTSPDLKGFYKAQATQLENKIANEMEVVAKDEAFYNLGKGVATIKTLEQVEKALDQKLSKIINASSTQAIGGAFNTGRLKVFETYPEKVYGFQYTAVLDHRTTNFCMSMNGRTIAAGDPAFSTYQPPNHVRCRSMWVAILKDEFIKPKITEIPKSLAKPKTGYTNFKDLQKIVLFKPTAAATTQELEILKKGIIAKAKKEVPKKAAAIATVVKQTETVKEAKTVEKMVTFTPVKTQEEGIARLKKHFDEVITPKKITTAELNQSLEVIEGMKAKYKVIEKIPKIDFTFRSKSTGGRLWSRQNGSKRELLGLEINLSNARKTKALTKIEMLKEKKQEIEKIKGWLVDLEKHKTKNPIYYRKTKRKYEEYIKDLESQTNFWTISKMKTDFTPLQNTIIHELGHAIDFSTANLIFGEEAQRKQIIGINQAIKSAYMKSYKKGYKNKLTEYSLVNENEFFAESIAAYENGLFEMLEPEVKKAFDKLIKYNP